jgi:hypothetical protein
MLTRQDVSEYLKMRDFDEVSEILNESISYQESYKPDICIGDHYKYYNNQDLGKYKTNHYWLESLVRVLAVNANELMAEKFDGVRFIFNKLTLVHFKNIHDCKYEIIVDCNKVKDLVKIKLDNSRFNISMILTGGMFIATFGFVCWLF